MFRPNTSEDISQKEYEQYISPYFDELKYYIESLDLHLSHGIDLFNNDIDKTENIKNKVKQILKDKYFLNIISEDPLDFEVTNYD